MVNQLVWMHDEAMTFLVSSPEPKVVEQVEKLRLHSFRIDPK